MFHCHVWLPQGISLVLIHHHFLPHDDRFIWIPYSICAGMKNIPLWGFHFPAGSMPKHSPWTALNPILLKGNLSTSDGFSRYQPGWLPAFPKLLMIRACDRNGIWWGRICCNCYGTQCTCSQEKNRPNQFLQLVCVLSWETLAMTPKKWCLAIRWFGNYK